MDEDFDFAAVHSVSPEYDMLYKNSPYQKNIIFRINASDREPHQIKDSLGVG